MDPIVTFVVPCYKLGHLLGECLESILGQTFGDFEVLVLDDCSPDDTQQVARSYRDPRIHYIRNQPNLGHLRNYNKGIGLAHGKYVWLISADDRLRRPHILERYMDVLENNPRVGYAFCPGVGLENGQEVGVLKYSVHGERDWIRSGHEFFIKLLDGNSVIAASGIVRKECYDKLGAFPLDLPYAGDWYLWCLFALHYDVAYLAEPMVHYRQHPQSMTNHLGRTDARIWAKDDLATLWRIKRKAEEAKFARLEKCDEVIMKRSALFLTGSDLLGLKQGLSVEDFEQVVAEYALSKAEAGAICAGAYAVSGDEYYWQKRFPHALKFYSQSLAKRPLNPRVAAQYILLRTGKFGVWAREAMLKLRPGASRMPQQETVNTSQ